MANLMLAFPDRAQSGSVSGGSWTAGLPASNLLTSVITQVARTADATASSTQLVLDAGRSCGINAIGLLNHNLSLAARVRIRGSMDPTFASSTYDSGWGSVWSAVYATDALEWEDDNWWGGTVSADSIGTMRPSCIVTSASLVYGRYWKIEIDDATNGAGYIQIGRLFLAASWVSERNPAYGWGMQWVPDATIAKALGGSQYFSPRSTARKLKVSLGWMSKAEAYTRALEMQRQLGAHGELLVVADQDDASTLQQRSFIARITASSDVRHVRATAYAVEFELTEVV